MMVVLVVIGCGSGDDGSGRCGGGGCNGSACCGSVCGSVCGASGDCIGCEDGYRVNNESVDDGHWRRIVLSKNIQGTNSNFEGNCGKN